MMRLRCPNCQTVFPTPGNAPVQCPSCGFAGRDRPGTPAPERTPTPTNGRRKNQQPPKLGSPIVEARGVTKSYRLASTHVPVLQGVDLGIRAGEFVAIVGPSGCGKTTLLNCLSGLDEIDSGSVVVDGQDLAGLSDRARTRHRAGRMGFVFQSFNLIPVLTAVQNVEMPLLILGRSRKEARERALESLDAVGLSDRATHRPGELSGGQQQRVAIARALVNEPAVVWADEPTGNLDGANSTQVLQLLSELNRRERVTLVVVTHDPDVAGAAHRTIRMDYGRIVDGAQPAKPEAVA